MKFLKAGKQQAIAAAVAFGSLVATAAAHAEVDASVGTAIAAVKADAVEVNGLVMPVMISIFGMGVVYKLVKRFGNKI